MPTTLILLIILSVGTNGVVGVIEESQEECSSCLKGNCQTISGLYTRQDLPTGYNKIATVPHGACKILLQQLKQTRNFIAIRNANGSYIINGHWKFSNSQVREGAGTRFVYRKQDSTAVETITGIGPLTNPVDIMIVNQEPNQGVKYQYSLPLGTKSDVLPPSFPQTPPHGHHHHNHHHAAPTTASHHGVRNESKRNEHVNQRDEPMRINVHRKRKRFAWKVTGTTPCSKTCGGGIQTTIITCVREHNQSPVIEKRCVNVERPAPQLIKCNQNACPDAETTNGRWDGVWGPCTGSCGHGVQQFIVQCYSGRGGVRPVVVGDSQCPHPKPAPLTSPCKLPPCTHANEIATEAAAWKTGAWSDCSVTCGIGVRSRSVTCSSSGNKCKTIERPSNTERCENRPCFVEKSLDSAWLVTEWSQCSVLCGTGEQVRQAICPIDTRCKEKNKPETTRPCSTDKQCNGSWFAGPWSQCTDPCRGPSKQTRDVLCVVQLRGQFRIANDATCATDERPQTERVCPESVRCPARWFVGEWSACDCQSGGVQKRDVRCLTTDGQPANGCKLPEMPLPRKSCVCRHDEDDDGDVNGANPQKKSVGNVRVITGNDECRDRIGNCYMAVQARLCQYQYYQTHCCISCAKALQDLTII